MNSPRSRQDPFGIGGPVLGVLLRMPAEPLIELIGLAGVKVIVIDCEYGPRDEIALMAHLAAARRVGVEALVRVAKVSDAPRVLDFGAAGVVVPHLTSADQAREVIRTAQIVPLGDRGLAAHTLAGNHGLTVLGGQRNQWPPFVIAMVEGPEALAVVSEIAAVPGIDGVLFGPSDLYTNLDAATPDPRIAAAVDYVRSLARSAGITSGSIHCSVGSASAALAAGDHIVLLDLPPLLADVLESFAALKTRSFLEADPDAGGREPLVMLSGMLADGTVWDDVLSPLSQLFAVRTPRIDLDDSVAEMAESVLAESPSTFALVGHSLGGIVALEIVRRAPHRVTRLALLNSTGRVGSDVQQEYWSGLGEQVEAGEFAAAVVALTVNTLPESRRGDEELVARSRRMAASIGPSGLLRQLAAQITRPDNLSWLCDIRIPTLVVTGDLDEVCPGALQRELVNSIPHARHVVLAGVGHMSPLEAPEQIVEALTDWRR